MKLRAALFNFTLAVTLALTFTAGAISPASVQAQAGQDVTIESVRVDVWPEYDQPSVLVIYHITLASTVTLPASLSVSIPAAAGKPYALAMQDVNGLYDLQYDLSAAGDWIKVSFTTPVPEVRLEYYDTALAKNGAQRDFSFRWPADYTVNNLVVMVQQPMTATNMSFRPDIGSGRVDTDGLTYFTQVVGEVAAGTSFDLDFSYNKPDDELTNPQQFQPAQPVQPVDSATPGRVTVFGISFTPLQVMLLIAGIVLILGGALWYGLASGALLQVVQRVSGGAPERKRHARHSTGPLPLESPAGLAEPVFCHKCGKKSSGGDAFCRACGTRLRG